MASSETSDGSGIEFRVVGPCQKCGNEVLKRDLNGEHGWFCTRCGRRSALPDCRPVEPPAWLAAGGEDHCTLKMFGTNALIDELHERGDLGLAVKAHNRLTGAGP